MREKYKNIMVCVTQQKSCERLIKRGVELQKQYGGQLHVIHVVKEGWKYFGKLKESDALEYLFEISKSHGADLTVIKAPDIVDTLKNFAIKNRIDVVVMGESLEKSSQQNMINRLKNKIKREIYIDVVPIKGIKEKAV